ncbi:hypothetical protein Tco_0246524 [Tanacetum coccineum]
MKAQSFRDLIILNIDSIKKCIAERKLHDQKTIMRLNERKLQMQECKVTMVQAFDATLVVTKSSGTESEKELEQCENKSSKLGISSSIYGNATKADGADIRPTYDTDSLEHVDNDDYNDDDLVKERELLASLFELMKLKINGCKKTNKSLESSNKALREANTFLNSELKRYKDSDFVEDARLKCANAYGCYNDNLALMLAPESDETIRLAQESRSKLSDLIKPFDYKNLNNLYELFVLQREKAVEQKYFSNDLRMSYTPEKNLYSKERKLRREQIQKDQALNSKPSMLKSTRLPNTVNGSKLKPRNSYQQPRNWPPSMSSCVSNKIVNIAEPPRNSKPFLNSKNLACPTCKKCIYTTNHDACILQYLSDVNSLASTQKTDSLGHRFSTNKTSAMYMKTTPPRSGLTWKPTGRIFTSVGLRWIPMEKTVGTCLNTNDNAIPLGKETSSSIKKIESHLGKIAEIIQDREASSLPSATKTNPRGLAHAITTRSGLNYKPPKNPLENDTNSQDKPATNETITKDKVKELDDQRKMVESYTPPIPFPGRLKKEKEKEQFKKFVENLQQLSINIPFIEALEQMPKYAKFMKDLLAKKGRLEETSKITLNERCSAVLLNKIPLKEKDPGSFTIPCIIGKIGIDKSLADLRASISLMPYSIFARLGLGELKPTRMCIELANKSTQYLRGITKNVIVKVDKFVFPVDIVVLDIEEDHKIPII